MEWLRPDIEEEFYNVENSLKRFMKKQYNWIEDIYIDKEGFQKNKMSKFFRKKYDINIVIDYKNLEMLKNNEQILESAEHQLEILFRSVIDSVSTFDHKDPKFIYLNLIPIIQY